MATIESPPASYVWTSPGSPIEVRLQRSLINGLEKLLARLAGSEGGVASGCGLLLGYRLRPDRTEIYACKPLSALDPSTIDAANAHVAGDVVGFYRTTEKGSLRMTEDDLALAHSHFSDPGSVVLLLETDKTGGCTAALFVWDQGRIYGDSAFLEFPFDAPRPALNERAKDLPESRTRPNLPRWKLRIRRRLSAVGFALAAALIIDSYFTDGWHFLGLPSALAGVSQSTGGASLGLSVQRRDTDLLLSWNRESPLVRSATSASLFIREGQTNRTVRLTKDELRSASILYQAATDQVDLELNVMAAGRVATESIQVLLPGVAQQVASVSSSALPPVWTVIVTPDDVPVTSTSRGKKRSTLPRKSNRRARR